MTKDSLFFIGKTVSVVIDRPLDSVHPKYADILYRLNYGHVPGTVSGDGEEIDAYVIGISEPVAAFTGRCIAVIRRGEENDDKLIIAPEDADFTDEAIRAATDFQERYFNSTILR